MTPWVMCSMESLIFTFIRGSEELCALYESFSKKVSSIHRRQQRGESADSPLCWRLCMLDTNSCQSSLSETELLNPSSLLQHLRPSSQASAPGQVRRDSRHRRHLLPGDSAHRSPLLPQRHPECWSWGARFVRCIRLYPAR